jgi:hypothetical protein
MREISRSDGSSSLLEPVAHKVRSSWDSPGICRSNGVCIGVAKFATHALVPYKRRIADDRISPWPYRLGPVGS